MTGSLMFLAVAALAGGYPPSRVGLRLAALLALLLAIRGVVTPTPYEPDWAYGLTIGSVIWMSALFYAGVVVRALATVALDRWDEVLRPILPLDLLIAALVGVLVGTQVMLALGDRLAGLQPPLAIHGALLSVALLAAGLAWVATYAVAWRWRSTVRAVGLGFSATMVIVTVLSLRMPEQFEAGLQEVAQGRPYCLMIGPDKRAPERGMEFLALTVPKPIRLVIADGERMQSLRWSFRGGRFVTTMLWPPEPPCTPTLP